MPNPPRARRTAALLLVGAASAALVVSTLSTPAQAAPPSGAAAATSTTTVTKHDRVWQAQNALSRAQKALSASTPADQRPDATLALRDLWRLKGSLSKADRAVADKLAGRPNKPSVTGDANIALHYDPLELNPAAYTIEQALASLQYVSNTYIASGYKTPNPDGTKGGDSRIDIYIDQLPPGLYGYCTTDQTRFKGKGHDVWAYCVLDNDYGGFPTNTPLENLQVTAAHEYFHAVQYAYDFYEDRWLMEATAAWAEDELYDDVDDNYQYLADSPITKPSKSMDKFGGSFHYGVWNFFRYVSELYPAEVGAMPAVVLQMWNNADSTRGPRKDKYSTEAIDKALKKTGKSSLSETFANYSAATRLTHVVFSEGAANNYPVKPLAGGVALASKGKKTFRTRLDHLSSATYQFTPSATAAGSKLKLRFLMGAKQTGARAVVATYTPAGVTFKTVKVNRRGIANKKFDFSSGTITAIEVTLVNASTRYANCYRRETDFACSGNPVDQKVRAILKAKAS